MPFTPSPALLNRFRQKALERLDHIEAALGTLAESGSDESTLKTTGRELHSLKGEAGMLGFDGVFEVARACEDLFEAAHRGDSQESSCTEQMRRGMALIRQRLPEPPAPPEPEEQQFVSEAKQTLAAVDGA